MAINTFTVTSDGNGSYADVDILLNGKEWELSDFISEIHMSIKPCKINTVDISFEFSLVDTPIKDYHLSENTILMLQHIVESWFEHHSRLNTNRLEKIRELNRKRLGMCDGEALPSGG